MLPAAGARCSRLLPHGAPGRCHRPPGHTPNPEPAVPGQLRKQMKYMLQVRFNGADTLIGRLPAEEQQKVTAEFQAIRQLPGVLDGYYIYDAPDLDAAIAFAARIPVARMGGTVEVREMVER